MDLQLSDLLKFADTDVNVGKLVVGLVILYAAYQVIKRSIVWTVVGLVSMGSKLVLSVFSPLGLMLTAFNYKTATIGLLAIGGTLTAGYGIGELRSGPREPALSGDKALTNSQIVDLMKTKDVNNVQLEKLLAYTDKRDQAVNTQLVSHTQVTANAEQPITRTGWMALLGGLGMLGVSITTFIRRLDVPVTG